MEKDEKRWKELEMVKIGEGRRRNEIEGKVRVKKEKKGEGQR